jgi:hypothetical protein
MVINILQSGENPASPRESCREQTWIVRANMVEAYYCTNPGVNSTSYIPGLKYVSRPDRNARHLYVEIRARSGKRGISCRGGRMIDTSCSRQEI